MAQILPWVKFPRVLFLDCLATLYSAASTCRNTSMVMRAGRGWDGVAPTVRAPALLPTQSAASIGSGSSHAARAPIYIISPSDSGWEKLGP